MNEYKKFSYYYDEVMAQLDYEAWGNFVKPYLKENDKILDLACGTGTLLMLLYPYNNNCYGLDLSETAIEIAKEKAKINHFNINYNILDMTDFSYDFKFDVITCFFDSINFLNNIELVNKLFKTVYNNLNKGGYFIFDIFSTYLFKEYNKNKYKYNTKNYKVSWKTKHINNTSLKHEIIIKDKILKNKYQEEYFEYYYDLDSLNFHKFKVVKIVGDFKDNLDPDDERILVVLQKE